MASGPPSTPAPTHPALPQRLDEMLGWRLAVAGRLLRTWADARLADQGIGAQALALLLWLDGWDGLTQTELARRQRVEAPTVCRMIDRLERDGLVERRPDPGDRRATRVHLTGPGRALASRGGVVVALLERDAFACLDERERRELARLLGRVMDGAGAPPGPAAARPG